MDERGTKLDGRKEGLEYPQAVFLGGLQKSFKHWHGPQRPFWCQTAPTRPGWRVMMTPVEAWVRLPSIQLSQKATGRDSTRVRTDEI